MRLWSLSVLFLLLGYVSSVLGQHAACQQLVIPFENYTQAELLEIAASCEKPAVSELYLNRAYYQRMVKHYRFFERSLTHYRGRAGQAYVDAYRIHIGLAEAFAANSLSADNIEVVEWLNRIYEQSSEIAEMRFRGYDLVADRMQRDSIL